MKKSIHTLSIFCTDPPPHDPHLCISCFLIVFIYIFILAIHILLFISYLFIFTVKSLLDLLHVSPLPSVFKLFAACKYKIRMKNIHYHCTTIKSDVCICIIQNKR